MSNEPEMGQPLRLGTDGRLLIPRALRQRLGLEPGAVLAVWVEGNRMIVQSPAAVEEELFAMFRNVKGSMADELIAERRAEAEREQGEYGFPWTGGSGQVAERRDPQNS